MSQEVLKKLAAVFANQSKILQKLAQMDPDYEEEDDFAYRQRKGKELLQKAIESGDSLPSDFEDKLAHYKNQKATDHFFWSSTENQLENLADGDESTWGEVGEYFPGWSPNNIRELLEKMSD